MNRKVIATGIVLILIGIILGAFGAHGLKKVVSDTSLLDSFETGVRYQIYHGFAFLIFGSTSIKEKVGKGLFVSFLVGVLFFSGSIFALVFLNIKEIEFPKFIAFITPLGGGLLIISWAFLLINFLRKN